MAWLRLPGLEKRLAGIRGDGVRVRQAEKLHLDEGFSFLLPLPHQYYELTTKFVIAVVVDSTFTCAFAITRLTQSLEIASGSDPVSGFSSLLGTMSASA